jgi:hypothetical protein
MLHKGATSLSCCGYPSLYRAEEDEKEDETCTCINHVRQKSKACRLAMDLTSQRAQ